MIVLEDTKVESCLDRDINKRICFACDLEMVLLLFFIVVRCGNVETKERWVR